MPFYEMTLIESKSLLLIKEPTKDCKARLSLQPFRASMLCSASIPCSFSCCAHNLCSNSLLPLYYVLYLHAIRCTSNLQFISCTWSHSTHMHSYQKRALLFYVMNMFITPSPLRDNPPNSSSYLAIILSLFVISGLS